MITIKHIERTLVTWHKKAPHLPAKHRELLADNSWRIVVIGAGLSIYSLFALVPMIVTELVLNPSIHVITPSIPYHHDTPGLAWAGLLATAIVFFITAIMLAIATYPMMEMEKRGWNLAFYTYLMNAVLGVVTTIMFPSLLELTVLIIVGLGAGYLLLEIRSKFSSEVKVKAKARV